MTARSGCGRDSSRFRLLEEASEDSEVGFTVTTYSSARVAPKVAGTDGDEAKTVGGNLLLPAPVVQLALFAPMDSAHGHPIRFVEVRNRLSC